MDKYYIAQAIVQNLLRFAQQRGLLAEEILQEFHGDIREETPFIPFEKFARLLAFLVQKSKDPAFGLHLGEQYNLAALGLVGQMIQVSKNIGEAIEKSIQNFNLISNVLSIKSNLQAQELHLEFVIEENCLQAFPLATKHLLSSSMIFAYKEIAFLTLREYPAKAIGLIAPPENQVEFTRIFKTKIQFEKSKNCLTFDRKILEEKIIYADYELLLTLEKVACQRLSHQVKQKNSLSNTIKAIVYSMLDPSIPSLSDIAKNLMMSERNLQRKLRQEGNSYSKIILDIKKEMALEYLKKDLSIKKISYLMGYSEPSAFVNAFKKWHGQTPLSFKSALMNKTQ